MPLLVCCNIATSWSADIPASWKVGAYCCIFCNISPDRSAPLAKPLLITSIACSPDRWKLAIRLSAVPRTSLKSFPIVSAVAAMLFLIVSKASPV